MTSESLVQLRRVESPQDPAIDGFGRLQVEVYHDSASLIPGKYISGMIASRSERRQNLLIVAERGSRVVGGVFFHYLAEAGSAFSSFMGISREGRGQGLARRLHEARFRWLDSLSGASDIGVFIDVVAPERLSPAEVEAERRFGYDPFARRPVFRALGFRKVDVPYRQPVGGPGGGPLENLDLLYCSRDPSADSIPLELALATLREYWQPWIAEERTERELDRLRGLCGPRVPLIDSASGDGARGRSAPAQ